jgi:BNR/Asp-box repeat protein
MLRRLLTVVAILVALLTNSALGQRPSPPPIPPIAPSEARLTLLYPSAWDVQVKERTKLETIKQLYERRPFRLAVSDAQDRAPLPPWFRAFVRDNLPEIPISGKYQYPRATSQFFEWVLAHPDLEVAPTAVATLRRHVARTVNIGGNINLTSFDELNSESFIAQDSFHPQFLIAAANNVLKSGHQRQFYSSDGGATWHRTELPLAPGMAMQCDPALAFATDGTAWAATLSIDRLHTTMQIQVFKSIDHGATWSFVSTLSTGRSNDKELMWIDVSPTSPFKDNIYVAWDVPSNGMRFSRSTDKGQTWLSELVLSTDVAIGCHLTSGPSGELYVAWPDMQSREIRLRKSTDGGATFAPTQVIATTHSSYEVSIPAMCQRNALIYVSLGVDRSGGPRHGSVYATWTDLEGPGENPGCINMSSPLHSRIYISASLDGNRWSAPHQIHLHPDSPPSADQFNQWMDVDQTGTIHVIFYDTRDDLTRRKTHLYYIASADGGTTWSDEMKVSSEPSDETVTGADGGNQYGDYNGLVAYHGIAFPSWTDRRSSNAFTAEQIFTAEINRSRIPNFERASEVETLRNASRSPASVSSQTQGQAPIEWNVSVPTGTRLEVLSRRLAQRTATLPTRDAEDRSPLPLWFRVYLRMRFPHLASSGPYQYPRNALLILQRMLENPNSVPDH